MSELIYAWLLRLFPAHFREAYGDAALQLFRDRSRDEKGFFARMRLWLDLLTDFAISLPREYRNVQPALIRVATQQRSDGVPSFHVLEGESPPFGALLFAGVLSLLGLGAFSILMNHVGSYRPPRASVARTQSPADAQSPTLSNPAQAGGDAGEETIAAGQPAAATTVVRPGDSAQAKARDASSVMIHAEAEEWRLDAPERQRVIDGAIANLKEYYVFPNVAQKIADALLAHEKSGDDNAVTDGAAFAYLLTEQMRDVSHDMHLRVIYSPVKTPDRAPGPTPEDLARYRKDMERENCTFENVEILPHNIGYLKFDEFPDPSVCRSTVAAAMRSVNRADTIIFDLRDNHGGDPKMVALIATYLFDHPTHLNDMYYPRSNKMEQSWTLSPAPGNRLANKPAYVLTSSSTFSGAEEFSYDLKNLKRATLVGETTAGGAHPVSGHRIDDHFKIGVPFARPINPISKTDWEGTGVKPDVKVKAADALETAEKMAETKLQQK